MLETAAAAQQTGVDIVIGLLNSDGRHGAIEGLLSRFEQLPASNGLVGEGRIKRIDLDAIRERLPGIVLVDTRPPVSFAPACGSSSLHESDTWTDIESVVDSGIDVWASLDATGFSSWVSVGVGVPSRLNSLSLL